MTCATVKVLPEPVTPSSTWSFSPRSRPSVSSAMACGWSPAGVNSETSSNGRPASGRWISSGFSTTAFTRSNAFDASGEVMRLP